MKVPLSWLNEYVDLSGHTVRELCDKLTFSGVEVEGVATTGMAYDGFVVGEVRDCAPHPNADRLRVCRVYDGAAELQIVCGAPNVAAGQKVCLAQIGALMADGAKLKKAKIRGVESCGMLCAEDELCLADRHEGLLVLAADLPAGRPLAEVLPPPETVLDLEITWNRPDCLSIIGIAREFAALLERPLRLPDVSFVENGAPVATLAAVRVEAPALCPRYTARVLTGVHDDAAPAWMRRRLEQCGIRPISLIVDVTNYVMLECGQPLHAFDYRRIAEHTIVVRRARAGETMTTLDNIPRTMDDQMLVIADPHGAVALAGVMGGAGSDIAVGATDTVLLESASFIAPSIKRTSTLLELKTESARRFERGVDPELTDWASRRATSLLVAHGGAQAARGALDVDARPPTPRQVSLRCPRAREVIGVPLTAARMTRILERLGLRVTQRNAEELICAIPSWRGDLEIEADLIEEIARMHGLAAIPDQAPRAVAVVEANDADTRAISRARQIMLSLGFTEALNYSFLALAELDAFDTRQTAARLVLPNPVSADYAVLRDTLLPQLIGVLGRNHARQVEASGMFEIGRVFGRDAQGRPTEQIRLSLGLYGPFGRDTLDRRRPVANDEAILWLKGALEAAATSLRAGELSFTATVHPAMMPGWAAEITLREQRVGVLGLVAAARRHQWRMNCPLAVAEVELTPLLAHAHHLPAARAVPVYPAVSRDLALVVPRTLSHAEIVACIRRAAPAELTTINLFDIFTTKETDSARHSMAYALEFRAPDRTLTDDEVNAAFQKIRLAVKQDLPVEIREG